MRDRLIVDDGLIMHGQRYVLPHSLQKHYLTQLHQGHPGLQSTKRRARETMFWPTLYSDIEREVSRCAPCNALKQKTDERTSATSSDVGQSMVYHGS